jgi:ribulose-5-phosphate 4-epimerase/fuculose-1-phosphate aldolase
MANLMGNPVALLLKGHGGSVAGATLEEVTARAIMLEEAAKVQILAGVAGKITRYAAERLKVSKQNWENKKFVIVGQAGFLERVWEDDK